MSEESWLHHYRLSVDLAVDDSKWTVPFDWFKDSELLGTCLFCGDCGRIWGKKWPVPVVTLRAPDYWQVEVTSCRAHGNGSFVNALNQFDQFVLDARAGLVPPEMLLYEFLCATDKGVLSCNSSRSPTPSATSDSSPLTDPAANSPSTSTETPAG